MGFSENHNVSWGMFKSILGVVIVLMTCAWQDVIESNAKGAWQSAYSKYLL